MTTNTRSVKPTPDVQRHAYSIDEWRAKYGFGRNLTYNLIAQGKLKTAKVGRRRVITVEADAEFRQSLNEASA